MRIPIDISPGLNSDDTTFAASPAWADGCNVRFRLGRPQTIGGWEKLTLSPLAGVCRGALAWTDNAATLTLAFGTHSNLQLVQGGGFYDVTPFGPPTLLGADPLTVANGSATVTVRHPAHGYSTGQALTINNVVAVGRITPSGARTITVTDADHYTFTWTANASVSKTLGPNPLSVLNGSDTVTVTETAHGIADGATVTVSGASAVGGITPTARSRSRSSTPTPTASPSLRRPPPPRRAAARGSWRRLRPRAAGPGSWSCRKARCRRAR